MAATQLLTHSKASIHSTESKSSVDVNI